MHDTPNLQMLCHKAHFKKSSELAGPQVFEYQTSYISPQSRGGRSGTINLFKMSGFSAVKFPYNLPSFIFSSETSMTAGLNQLSEL